MPPLSLLDLFRTLSSFSPARVSLKDAPWEEYVDWAIYNGLAPLAAYNLEYRLAGGGAPEWVRDRLLSVYQGTANDNVMKLVSFKRAVDDLEGRRILMLGGAVYAEAVYPHVAFRPVPELRIRVAPEDVGPFAGYLKTVGFKDIPGAEGVEGSKAALSDDHTPILLFGELLGERRADAETALLERALPVKVYGKSVFRPELEDAVLLTCLELARAGFETPMVGFVDLRELVTGSNSVAGPYSRPLRPDVVRERASAWRLERGVWAAMNVLARLFPEARDVAMAAAPEVSATSRALLERIVVGPVSSLGRVRTVRGVERLRRLVSGGG